MCGLVSYPMHGVNNVDVMRGSSTLGRTRLSCFTRGLGGECVLYLAVCADVSDGRGSLLHPQTRGSAQSQRHDAPIRRLSRR